MVLGGRVGYVRYKRPLILKGYLHIDQKKWDFSITGFESQWNWYSHISLMSIHLRNSYSEIEAAVCH